MTPLQKMKICIKDAEHSKQVQECLFKLGFGWGSQLVREVENHQCRYLYASTKDHTITWSHSCIDYLNGHKNTEVTLEDLQAMLSEPDEIPEGSSTAPTFSMDDTISTYISQIQKRLADTNLSVSIYGDEIRVASTDNDDEVSVKSWEGVLEIIKVKQAYLNVFKDN